ncbi:MAG: PatB family C-S lyase [Clostridia bacterium]|nr:PatB family C-S lyase [Clostridia bacterium]
MKEDFNEVIDRLNTNSVKWDLAEKIFGCAGVLPMWVADMDFLSPREVIDAITQRARHGIYGYTERPDSYYMSVINWMQRRHGCRLEREWLINCPGVVPSLNSAVKAFTKPGDKVIVQPPVYYPFFSAVTNQGCEIVYNNLILDNGRYMMDFEDLEEKMDKSVKALILCSPHNPVGRVWTRQELARLGEICLRNNVVIISDEIHCDILLDSYRHTHIFTLSQELQANTVTCISPSKTFNLAGLSTSMAIIPDKRLREKYSAAIASTGFYHNNIFGITALETAYNYGEEWLDKLLTYLGKNLNTLEKFFQKRIPGIKVIRPEGTYLVWLDCRSLDMEQKALVDLMAKKAGVGLEDGQVFGPGGEGFLRINIACPHSLLEEGLTRIEKIFYE